MPRGDRSKNHNATRLIQATRRRAWLARPAHCVVLRGDHELKNSIAICLERACLYLAVRGGFLATRTVRTASFTEDARGRSRGDVPGDTRHALSYNYQSCRALGGLLKPYLSDYRFMRP